MDPALIALPATALLSGGLIGFLVASIAFDRDARGKPRATFDLPVKGSDDEGWTEPPRISTGFGVMGDACQRMAEVARGVRPDVAAEFSTPNNQSDEAVAESEAQPGALTDRAIFHTAQALAELTRFNRQGASGDRFPLEEDVEVFLAKALQDTINILLAYQPTEHERGELAQLEAAIHKFVTDYGA